MTAPIPLAAPDGTCTCLVSEHEPDCPALRPVLTDRERACLRGEHEAARFEDAYCMGYSAMPIARGFASWLLRVCAHCRCVFVPRSP